MRRLRAGELPLLTLALHLLDLVAPPQPLLDPLVQLLLLALLELGQPLRSLLGELAQPGLPRGVLVLELPRVLHLLLALRSRLRSRLRLLALGNGLGHLRSALCHLRAVRLAPLKLVLVAQLLGSQLTLGLVRVRVRIRASVKVGVP